MEIRKLITIWQGINCRSRKQRESFILRNLRWIRINWRIRRNSFLPFPWLQFIFFSYFPIRHPRHGQVDHLLPNVVLFGWLLRQSHRSFGGSSNYTGGLWLWLLEQGVGKVVIHEEDQQNEDNLKKPQSLSCQCFIVESFPSTSQQSEVRVRPIQVSTEETRVIIDWTIIHECACKSKANLAD